MIVVAPDIGGVGAINPTLLKGATPQLIVSTNKDTTTSCSFGLPAFAAQARIVTASVAERVKAEVITKLDGRKAIAVVVAVFQGQRDLLVVKSESFKIDRGTHLAQQISH